MDIKILNILAEHAELNNKELAKKIGLSEGPTMVRVKNLWERGVIKSYGAIINLQFFGYCKFYLIRVEISDSNAVELKQRLSINRYIIIFIEIDGSIDLVKRIYIAICQTKNLKAAKEEVHNLTEGIKEIRAVTFSPINYAEQKAIRLEDSDLMK